MPKVRNALLCPYLALCNLRSNRRDYLPFLGAASLIVCLFFTVCNISESRSFARAIPGSGTLHGLMTVATLLLPVVCGPFLWYINSFLMKRRSRELGLYGVLGLERRHVGAVLLFETLYSLAISLVVGLGAGLLLMGLSAGLLLRLAGITADYTPQVAPGALAITAGLFGVIFLGCLAGSFAHLSLATPTELLREDHAGEKDPRFGVIGCILGVALLGGGYTVAIRAYHDPMLALMVIPVFFLASLLAALGTYGVFIFGSIYCLKALKANKGFYYRPQNFVTLSGMLHRMRKNGAGLANICLFGTMTLVTLCCTLTVAFGQGEVMALLGTANRPGVVSLNLEQISPEEITVFFGTLAFLGIFFGAAFLLCTVLVMYYKQIVEGSEDRDGYIVMRRVGMSGGMVRATVRRQVTLVFLLPLLMALMHLCFATPVLIRLFDILCISQGTVLLGSGAAVVVFVVLYIAAYLATAKAYYRIVSG